MGVTEIIASLFAITKHSLSIYETKQSRKYLDRVIYLEKVYYAEENKPEDQRSHAVMDNVSNELCSSLRQLPSLKNRSLRIHVEKAKFYYQYETCSGKLWWKKCKMVQEYYDFNDIAVRKQLKDMGFKLKIIK